MEEGAEILISGLDSLIDATVQADVTELAVVARLLGRHDGNTIHITLMTVSHMLGDPDLQPGEIVTLPLRDVVQPLSREVRLEALTP